MKQNQIVDRMELRELVDRHAVESDKVKAIVAVEPGAFPSLREKRRKRFKAAILPCGGFLQNPWKFQKKNSTNSRDFP
nr:hypothetical protein [Treponema sp.]